MIVLLVLRNALEPAQDRFETRIVGPIHGNVAERFDKGGEQSRGFRSRLRVQSFHGATAQIFRQLIGPERFDDGGQLVEAGGNGAPCRRVRVFETARIIQNDVARFAARSIGAGIGKLPQGLAQCGDRNAPDIRPAQDCRFFARRKL